jgi:cytochrome c peroxidase
MKNSAKLFFCLLALSALFMVSCKRENTIDAGATSAEVPVLPVNTFDYPNSGNDNLATLGRVLFYDKTLSRNSNISCGSCHQQKNAFTDNKQFSLGTDNLHTLRNTPSIFPKNGRLFWDGRSGSLEELALMPVRNDVEMNMPNMNVLIGRIAQTDYYNELFDRAFLTSKKIDSNSIKKALAEFLKNFNFSNNKFHRSQKGEAALSPSEQIGKDLFFGRAQCSNCHHLQADQFQSNGGYGHTDESHNIGLDAQYADDGVGAFTGNKHEQGAFMMPVLLNVEFTSPYMHDGRFKTLEEVVEHYNSEIKAHPALDSRVRDMRTGKPLQLKLTPNEKAGLVDFLKSLSDHSIFEDPKFSDPFVARQK